MGQLDAAITNEAGVLDDRLDAIIIASGTSDAETIAARTSIEYKAGSPPATLGTALGYAGLEIHNVKAYGALPANTAAQNTTAINAAIAAAIDGVVVFPGTGDTYEVNEIAIANNCHIIGNGNLLMGQDDPNFVIFAVTAALDWLHITGFDFDWETAKATETEYDAFTNGTQRGGLGGDGYSGVWFEIGELLIEHCNFRGSRVFIWSNGTATRPTVQHCTWGIGPLDPDDDLWFNGALLISGKHPKVLYNRFEVYCTTSATVSDARDIMKVTPEATVAALITGNYFKNFNAASLAEVDLYDGGYAAIVDKNVFINARIERKQVGAGAPFNVASVMYDKITNNHFELSGATTWPLGYIFFNGALGIISGNTFYGDNTSGRGCIEWEETESYSPHEILADGVATPYPIGVIITNNLSHNVDYFVLSRVDTAEPNGYSVISNNVIWNASYLFRVFGAATNNPVYTSIVGNVWVPSATPANQVAVLVGTGNRVLGNAVLTTLGAFTPPITFGEITAASIYTGSMAINDDEIGSFTPTTDRGIIKVWTGSASTEAAMFAYRTTATSHHAGVMSQESTIMAAAIVTGVPVFSDYTDTKITLVASTNGILYFVNRRGGARTLNYSVEAA